MINAMQGIEGHATIPRESIKPTSEVGKLNSPQLTQRKRQKADASHFQE
jgi:hypothetical protein